MRKLDRDAIPARSEGWAPPATKARADEPLLASPDRARALLGYGVTKFYKLLNSGAIASIRDGAARRVVTASLHQYVARMLAEAGAPPAQRPARMPPRFKKRATTAPESLCRRPGRASATAE
jgi:hypothetical protein